MKTNKGLILTICILIILIAISYVYATPIGPTVTLGGNSTKETASASTVNYTGNDTDYPNKAGGFIFTINLESNQQNSRWKAYVGNVTGTLVLDDADSYTIYDWSITTSLTGEVYATRASGSINWTNINCSYSNATYWEDVALNHTSPTDNISTTFNDTDNSEFYVGTLKINASTCPTINLHVNDTSDLNDNFEEVLLYDGNKGNSSQGGVTQTNNTNFKNIVYAAIIEENAHGYRGQAKETYDFQMLLPEIGLSSWTSSTPYYFYVELT